jgi:hypothetical protein
MRKVTEQTVKAFLNYERKTVDNTESTGNELKLHGNVIAKRENGHIYISDCGWQTATTKERLNGLLWLLYDLENYRYFSIYQEAFVWYWKDKEEFPSNTYLKVTK